MRRVYTAAVEQRRFGATGLSVSAIGLGAGSIGGADEASVDRLVGAALDEGVTLIDTARSYGRSEELLGRALEGRRDRVVLSTKIGYGIEGFQDWTPACISAGVDVALRLLRTDCIDVVHLHSCPLEVLRRPGLIEALLDARANGKLRVAAYSGEGEALSWAVRSGAFGAVQCSVSVVDQGALAVVAEARDRGLGVIAKRALGNAPWRFAARPPEPDVAEAWDRFRALKPGPPPYTALFARFAAFAPGVSSALVGTASEAHLRETCAAVAEGPLADAGRLRRSFDEIGRGWQGRI